MAGAALLTVGLVLMWVAVARDRRRTRQAWQAERLRAEAALIFDERWVRVDEYRLARQNARWN